MEYAMTLPVKGLFTSVDGESLTSASGKICKRGEAIVVSLHEYGNKEYEELVRRILNIQVPSPSHGWTFEDVNECFANLAAIQRDLTRR